MTRQSKAPVLPARSPESATPDGAPQRIALRRSVAMWAALGVFVLTATSAVFACLAWHLGTWQAVPLTLTVWAWLALCALRYQRAQPVALKIGPDGLSVWGRTGALLAQGRIAGCSQWSGRLLILALMPEQGCSRTLLFTADALPAPIFRELAVLGRRGAGG
ncbi:hypothetical protein [Paraburkholderia sp. USG1]|uniref:hypothetical protein n=1 Tax=Paraburkholderia sp. USG1 TaxID=2952268 RepID=UPI002870ABA9|nr:hypothetical protein [Paraburkholderia sp. USG1]